MCCCVASTRRGIYSDLASLWILCSTWPNNSHHHHFHFFMNTCWVPHLKMSPKHFTMTTIMQLSLRLHSSHVWLSVASHIAFWIFTEMVTMLFGCYMAGTMWSCCHLSASSVYNHTGMHQFTVSLYLKPHTQDACVLSRNLPPALLAEWLGSFRCYCGNTGVEWILK